MMRPEEERFSHALECMDRQALSDLGRLYTGIGSDAPRSLKHFFASQEVRRNLPSFTTKEEGHLLSMIALVQSVDRRRLVALLPTEEHVRLCRSLFKRLLLVEDGEGVHLNPILEWDGVLSMGGLQEKSKRRIRLKETVAALISLLCQGSWKSDGWLQRGLREALAPLCPLMSAQEVGILIERMLPALVRYGVIRLSGGRYRLSFAEARSLLSLDEAGLKALLVEDLVDEPALLAAIASRCTLASTLALARLRWDEVDEEAISSLFFALASPSDDEGGMVVIQSDYTVRTPDSGTVLPFITQVHLVDSITTRELFGQCISRGLDLGLSKEEVLCALEGAPNQIRTFVEDIAGEKEATRIIEGIYFETDEDLCRIIAALPQMEKYIIKRITQHSFLLDPMGEEAWRGILADAGLVNLPPTVRDYEVERRLKAESLAIPAFPKVAIPSLADERSRWGRKEKDGLRKAINQLPQKEREDGLALLEHGYIVAESQVGHTPPLRRSLSPFDYRQKLKLLRQACEEEGSLWQLTVEGRSYSGCVVDITGNTESAYVVLCGKDGKTVTLPVGLTYSVREIPD